MSDIYMGSQAPLYQNVYIRTFNQKTGKVRIERQVKNRVTKLMLLGIVRFLAGEFSDSTPDKLYEYIPRYLALGSNRPNISEPNTAGVTTEVTTRDSRLLNEYKLQTSTGRSEPVKRISIQGRQHSHINTSFRDDFIKITFSTYISSAVYNDLEIAEAGLFSKERDNNCLARVVFAPFVKKAEEVIDVRWEITLLSYGNTKYPDSVTIPGPNRVIIGLNYTPYHIKTSDLGLYLDGSLIIDNFDIQPIWSVDENGFITNNVPIEEIIGTQWDEYLQTIMAERNGKTALQQVYDAMSVWKVEGDQFVYADDPSLPGSFYLADYKRIEGRENLLADVHNNLLKDVEEYQLISGDPSVGTTMARSIMMSYIFKDEYNYTQEDTKYRLLKTDSPIDFIVRTPEGDEELYKVVANEVFKKDQQSTTGYTSMQLYLYKGTVINERHAPAGYFYTDPNVTGTNGIIYKDTTEPPEDVNTGGYLVRGKDSEGFTIFNIWYISEYGIVENSGYWIDWSKDKETYQGTNPANDTLYHVTNDNYFAIGDTHKFVVSIYPSDSTDKSIVWGVTNSNIAKMNDYGVAHAWNLGETLGIATTTNNVKARVIIEVVKNASIIDVDQIILDPEEITFIVDAANAAFQSYIVTARIIPAHATYTTVEWSLDIEGMRLVKIAPLENNQVKVMLPDTTTAGYNIGRGYLTATTQDGMSARCLINCIFETDFDESCPDPSHEEQQA